VASATNAAVSAAPLYGDVSERGSRLVLIVLGVMAASLMQTLDTTITNVALPNIQGNLGASQDEGTWIVTAYTIAAIVVIPITPWLQNRFGRKRYYVASIVGFTLASIMCGASDKLVPLVVWRAVQACSVEACWRRGNRFYAIVFRPTSSVPVKASSLSA